MKKITLLLALFAIVLQSCTVNENSNQDTIDNDTYSEVFEVTRSFTPANNFTTLVTFPHQIYNSDMLLVYRLSGQTTSGHDIWKPLPEAYFFSNGTLDFKYDFNFTKFDTEIYMEGFDLASVSANYRTNQVLRIVIVPAYFGKKDAAPVNYNDYNAVIQYYHINDTAVTKIK